MGGYNSGRWHDHSRKLTVEECSKLKVADFPRSLLKARFEAGAPVYYDESGPSLYTRMLVRRALDKLYPHQASRSDAADRPRGQPFRITRTACNYGGWRYWLICPTCRRRCGVLYHPVGLQCFACRTCYHLTYTSCQDSRHPVGYGALAIYLTRSSLIERKLSKVKRWRKRAYRLDAQSERLHARLGWAWYSYAAPLFAETGIPLELEITP